ncbi:late embryogenesis abundant protein-related [Striga asiatica]|uniref:Late embryogenesis abundant protein-related n=1 Tax=Striga asiatica TaxID=4170 RepID=A0A5A7PGA9_STRAF|nr:late embryogenesis abundant protein-related [Striga asiatica]
MESQRVPGQAQMRRDNPPSDTYSQGQTTNFLEETGKQVKNMGQGAAEVGKGAVNLAANITQGAVDAVKNTIGINNDNNSTITTSNLRGAGGGSSTVPNLMDTDADVAELSYPTNHNNN